MAVSSEFIARLEELFFDFPSCTVRKMFGGVGVFHQGLMFALGTDAEGIAFKADEVTIPAFIEEGATEWILTNKKGKQGAMGYWYVPERLFDEPEEFLFWAQRAFEVAMRADAKKPLKQRKLVSL